MFLAFFIRLFASLLPGDIRAKWLNQPAGSFRRAAILSGLSQMIGCMAALLLGYKPFVMSQFAQIDSRIVTAGLEKSGETAVMGMGLIIAVAYILRPLSILLFYFSFEGAVRAISAFTGNELIGTLPLYLLLLVGRKAEKEVREFKLGPRVVDQVLPAPEGEAEYDLVIASCRPKNWTPSLSIDHEDHLYELVRSFESEGPRRFVYLLRKAPLSKLVRGLHHYDPAEGLLAESLSER